MLILDKLWTLPVSHLRPRPVAIALFMSTLILIFGFYILYPLFLIFINSFNAADIGDPFIFTLGHWRTAFADPQIFQALKNTFYIYFLYTGVSFPIAVIIAWLLARTNIPGNSMLEFMFWMSFMIPTLSVTVAWTFLLDPFVGALNYVAQQLPFIEQRPFNIYSVWGIVWVHLMGNAISVKVMLLTPAFRNMNLALEDAAAVSGASRIMTLTRVTLPLMVPPMTIVFMLDIVRVFQSFEIEQILGTPTGFFIFSTKIFDFIRNTDPPQYGQATALASTTLILIALVIPVQRWLLQRRRYTTVSGQFKPGLIALGQWRWWVFGLVTFLVLFLTLVPLITLVGGTLMTRVGFFQVDPLFTLQHWTAVFKSRLFVNAVKTTFILALSTAVVSPILFSVVAYVLVRTRWHGRVLLDTLFWLSAAVPGILSGLGLLWLFLGTPLLVTIYGTIYALVLVVILQGKLLSTQMIKSVFLQMGADLEESALVSGAGYLYTYFRIWLPLLMPTLVLIGIFNFVIAAGATSSIVLLASRGTATLSLLILDMMGGTHTVELERAGVISLVMVGMTTLIALVARPFGFRVGVRHI